MIKLESNALENMLSVSHSSGGAAGVQKVVTMPAVLLCRSVLLTMTSFSEMAQLWACQIRQVKHHIQLSKHHFSH